MTPLNCPVHFIGNPFARTIYVTEGILKADIAHVLLNRSFVAVAGANNVAQLGPLFGLLAQNGTELIIEAHDMDKYSNEMIAKGSSKICLRTCIAWIRERFCGRKMGRYLQRYMNGS